MGADAVLVNTAIAAAGNPAEMGKAFAMAVKAAELAINSNPIGISSKANASSPMGIFDQIV
jgi:thiazole synthase